MTRLELEARATELGIKFTKSTKSTTLEGKIQKEEAKAKSNDDGETRKDPNEEVMAQARASINHDGEDIAAGEEFVCTRKQRDALIAAKAAIAVE